MTWWPEIWHTVSFDGYLHYVKILAFHVQPFWSYLQKVKTWTHLSEKQPSKATFIDLRKTNFFSGPLTEM